MNGHATRKHLPESTPGLFDLDVFSADPAHSAPWLLIEVPHGATESVHYRALRDRLQSPLPDDLESFFHINTDIGAPEVADGLARRLAEAGVAHVVVMRCLVPRTFIDCNRALEHPGAGAVTLGLPGYIEHDEDRRLLTDLHTRYTEAANQAYAAICDADRPGCALNLHTYAPRSVAITEVKRSIVEDLRAAYAPEVYGTWPIRPEVDLICRTTEGQLLAPEPLVRHTVERLTKAGFEVKENNTYRLYRATMGFWHSKRHPGRVLCLEIRRDLLTEDFEPFQAMKISSTRADSFAAPLSAAFADLWSK